LGSHKKEDQPKKKREEEARKKKQPRANFQVAGSGEAYTRTPKTRTQERTKLRGRGKK